MLLLPTPRRVVTLAQTCTALVLPHGGQAAARRNAWSSMVDDAQRTRDRREAEAALLVAGHRAGLVATGLQGRAVGR